MPVFKLRLLSRQFGFFYVSRAMGGKPGLQRAMRVLVLPVVIATLSGGVPTPLQELVTVGYTLKKRVACVLA